MKYLITSLIAFVLLTPAAFAVNDWTQINESGFGDPANNRKSVLFSRAGELYAIAGQDGLKAYQYDQNGNTDWTEITAWPMLADEYLRPQEIRIRPSNKTKFFYFSNYVTGAEIWRLKKDGTWDQINEDGFGDIGANYIKAWSYYKGPAMNNRPSIVVVVEHNNRYKLLGHKLSKGADKWKVIDELPKKMTNKLSGLTAYKKRLYINSDGDAYKSKHAKKWHKKNSQIKVKRSGGFAVNAKRTRLYSWSRSKSGSCGKYRNELWASPDGTEWNSLESRPERKFCYSDMTFKKNGRTLVTGFTDIGNDKRKMIVYSRKKKDWKLLTKNGFGNSNNEYATGTTVWKSKLVLSTYNKTNGTEVFMKNMPEAK